MGSIWGLQDPGGPHVGPMNFAIWSFWLARSNVTDHRQNGGMSLYIIWGIALLSIAQEPSQDTMEAYLAQ